MDARTHARTKLPLGAQVRERLERLLQLLVMMQQFLAVLLSRRVAEETLAESLTQLHELDPALSAAVLTRLLLKCRCTQPVKAACQRALEHAVAMAPRQSRAEGEPLHFFASVASALRMRTFGLGPFLEMSKTLSAGG